MPEPIDDMVSPSRLEQGITELQTLHELLVSGEVDPRILTDFRDALNRVRNTAWAVQQYIVRTETGENSNTLLSFLAGERIRAAYNLTTAVAEDLKKDEIEFRPGSLVQLHEATKALTAQLDNIVRRLG